jgi:dsDNA-specific endonuclease/ATPase MutS2
MGANKMSNNKNSSDPDGLKPDCPDQDDLTEEAPIEVPINGELDLHTFSPKDLKYLIPDYLDECRQRGILRVRVVHGKGTGALRKSVHAILDRLDSIDSYRAGGMGEGSWGATLVFLRE